MITIVKHGQDAATRLAISRWLAATGATKLGTAYETANGTIPPRLVAAVTRPAQLQQHTEQLQQQPAQPGLQGDPTVLDDIVFMLQFFQSNGPKLIITPEQKIRFKSILERVKQARA